MKDAYYFSHDANAQHDPKIIRLLQKHGWEGYGLFWAIVELLRNEADYRLKAEYDCYAFALRTDSKLIKSIVEDFDLFEIIGDYFHSISLTQRMAIADAKRAKCKDAALIGWEKRKKKQEDNADALHPQCDSNAMKGKERKRNEKKRKDIDHFFDLFWLAYPRKVAKKKAKVVFVKNKLYDCIDDILIGIKKLKESDQWQTIKFIPHPSTFLNNERWKDEVVEDKEEENNFRDVLGG